jgi:integrase/recombinase XerD
VATHLLNRGAGGAAVQQLLGHKYLETTVNYATLDFARIRAVYDAVHPWS